MISGIVPKLYTLDAVPKSEPSEAGPILRRKKEPTDVKFSRRLRKPGKRNAVGVF